MIWYLDPRQIFALLVLVLRVSVGMDAKNDVWFFAFVENLFLVFTFCLAVRKLFVCLMSGSETGVKRKRRTEVENLVESVNYDPVYHPPAGSDGKQVDSSSLVVPGTIGKSYRHLGKMRARFVPTGVASVGFCNKWR